MVERILLLSAVTLCKKCKELCTGYVGANPCVRLERSVPYINGQVQGLAPMALYQKVGIFLREVPYCSTGAGSVLERESVLKS